MSNNIINLCNNIDNVMVSEAYQTVPENCKNLIPQSKRQLMIITQNIRSISKNFDDFTIMIERTKIKPDIIILTECWLQKSHTLPVLDGYDTASTHKNTMQNDGVVVFIKTNIKYSQYEPSLMDSNCLVTIVNGSLALVSIYRSPSYNKTENFILSLNSLLTKLVKYKNIVLMGDININIIADTLDRQSSEYLELLAFHGLLPSHMYPTRLTNCLDHCFIKTTQSAITIVIKNTVTDHDSVLVVLRNQEKNSTMDCYTTYEYTKINYEAITKELAETDFEFVLSATDCDSATEAFVNYIMDIVKKNSLQVRRPRRQTPLKPWITPGLIRCMRHRDRLHTKTRKDPDNESLKICYKRYRNFCNSLLRKLKNKYEKDQLDKAGNNMKKTWQAITSITNFKPKKSLTQNLIQTSDPQKSVDLVNDFFANVGKNLAAKITKDVEIGSEELKNNSNIVNSFGLVETTETEIISLINALKTDSSTGWDDISSRIIKQNQLSLIKPLVYICNLSFNTAVFPKAFKRSVILPVHKNGDKMAATNYRPISILPALSKILERAINTRLVNYLEKYNLLSNNQYGFRKGRSTADAVSEVNNFIIGSLDVRKKCLAIFIDLAKAFDTVSIPLLLHKLQNLGVRGKQLDLMKSYLTDRNQCVKIGKFISRDSPVTYGIPQGSILGPTLFLAYLNDICQTELQSGKLIAFADDTVLLFQDESWEKVYDKAQLGFNLISKQLYKNILTLNTDKTKYMKFYLKKITRPGSTNSSLQLRAHTANCLQRTTPNCVDCPFLECCDTIKYLGVTLDSMMTYVPHINLLTSRIRKLMAVFKKIKHAANESHIYTIYFALCESLLTYCATAWGGAAKTHLLPLERAQRAVLKVAFSKPYRYSTVDLYADCKLLTVRQLCILHFVLRQHHKSRMLDETSISKRRKDRIYTTPHCNTQSAQKHFHFLAPYIYNIISKQISIRELTYTECKVKTKTFLLRLDYNNTENLIKIVS